MDGDIKV